MYPLVKPLFFRFDPERIHDALMNGLEFAAAHPGALRLMRWAWHVEDTRLQVNRFGLSFSNPIGLAAGFDKNARAVPSWLAMGFGFVEVGSITALAQPGNPKPRLFRLPADEAIINRMGFNNEGAEQVAKRLERLFASYGKPLEPVGINLGKSKVTPLAEAAGDYERSLKLLYAYGDYFVVNVSSPNTPGLRELQDKDKLENLLSTVQSFIQRQTVQKPVLIKIAPDLGLAQIDEILALAETYTLSGIIATNTTVARTGLKTAINESGGLSGKPLKVQSLTILRHIYKQVGAKLPIISVGGLSTPEDVIGRLKAGASLVQLYTSLIYAGPGFLKQVNQAVLEYLERENLVSVEALIGTEF